MRTIRFFRLFLLLALISGCTNIQKTEPTSAPITGAHSLSKLPPPPPWRPTWGMWGVNPEDPSMLGPNGKLAMMKVAGISIVSLDGWISDSRSTSQINADIDSVKNLGIPSVVVSITHPQIDSATRYGLSVVSNFINAVHTPLFCMDEPRYNRESSGTISQIGQYINTTSYNGSPRRLYIADPDIDNVYDPAYYGTAYKLLPNYYTQPLSWKSQNYALLSSHKPIAPMIGLMWVAGYLTLDFDPTFDELCWEVNTAKPYCSEIWFYTVEDDFWLPGSQYGYPAHYNLFASGTTRWSYLQEVLSAYSGGP